jgi:hypothetical protein
MKPIPTTDQQFILGKAESGPVSASLRGKILR